MDGNAADRNLIQAVEAIYATIAAPETWPSALHHIAECLGDVGAILLFQRDDGSYGTIVSPGLAAAQADYEREWWRHDIVFSRFAERGYATSRQAVTTHELVTTEEVERHPIFTGFLLPHGLGRAIGVGISPDPRLAANLAIHRSMARHAHTEEECTLAVRLGRHVENALRIGIRLLTAELSAATLNECCSRLGIGVFFLDHHGRVVSANAKGDQILGDALLNSAEGLRARFAAEQKCLQSVIAGVLQRNAEFLAGELRPLIVHGLDPEQFVAVYVLPIVAAGEAGRLLMAGVSAVVLAVPSRASDPVDPSLVRDLLGLTLSEARVAALVGQGLAPRATAERLGITEETVRSALKRVFWKTGVSRQSELVLLLTKLVLH